MSYLGEVPKAKGANENRKSRRVNVKYNQGIQLKKFAYACRTCVRQAVIHLIQIESIERREECK
jgi:hypothetical protein